MWYHVGLLLLAILPLIFYRNMCRREERTLAKAWGCQAPRDYPLVDKVFGLDFLIRTIRLVRKNQIIPASLAYHEKYGKTFRVMSQGKAVFYTIEAENLQAIYDTKCVDWGVEPHRLKAMRPLCGSGHITSDGKDWERADAMLRPSLVRSNVDDLVTFGVAVEGLLDRMPQSGATVDMSPILDEFFFDIATHFLLGQRFSAISSQKPVGIPDGQTFLRSLHTSQFWSNMRVFFGLMGRVCSFFIWRPYCRVVHLFVDHYVDMALQDEHSRQRLVSSDGNCAKTVVSQRSLVRSLLKHTSDRVEIRWRVIQSLILMEDTTSTLVSNTLFLLSRSPATWMELRKEILESNSEELSATVLIRLTVLQKVLKESLRLYPVLGQSGRTALRNTSLPAGGGPDASAPIFVPAGSVIFNNWYSLHRQTAVFGEDAASFNPDRWNHITPRPCEYMPFGHGQRHCAGEHKALVEASYLIAKIALRFARIESRDDENWVGDWKLIVRNLNGCRIALLPE